MTLTITVPAPRPPAADAQTEAAETGAVADGQPLAGRLELPARGLTRGDVLQACETLRRRLARHLTGTEGASAGLVDVTLEDLPAETRGQVVVRATVVDSGGRWQRVRYEASLRPSPAIVIDGLAFERPLGGATGLTVALNDQGLDAADAV